MIGASFCFPAFTENVFFAAKCNQENLGRGGPPTVSEDHTLNRNRDGILGRRQFWIHGDLFKERFRIRYHEKRELFS